MRRIVIGVVLLTFALGIPGPAVAEQQAAPSKPSGAARPRVAASSGADSRYRRPLKPRGYDARAVVLPARSLGPTVLRARDTMAVAIEVRVEDYLPRALEPTLVIDGTPVRAPSSVAGVEKRITRLVFYVDQPDRLRDGGTLAIQMGDEKATRAPIPGALRLRAIKPLDPSAARRAGVSSLDEWLRPPSPR